MTWNEAEIIPWFLSYYCTFADRIFVFDGGSTDGTREIVARCEKARLLDVDSGGVLRDDLHAHVKSTAWQGREPGWVICVDADEFLFSPCQSMRDFIHDLDRRDIAVCQAIGVNMFGETMPPFDPAVQLYDHFSNGMRVDWYSKCALFHSGRIDRIDYEFGCHRCHPSWRGRAVEPAVSEPPLYLLHFKNIGGWDRVVGRFRRSAQRLSEFNHIHGLGVLAEEAFRQEYVDLRDYSGPVPGLGGARLEQGPLFTTDWVSGNVPVWRRVLEHLAGRPAVRILEVGTFEGRTAVWLCQNILTHPDSHLTVVDTFAGGRDQIDFGMDVSNLRSRFERNIRPYASRVRVLEEHSAVALRKLEPNGFDAIYLDGDHFAASVLEDAVLSWALLRPGGVLIFDDYEWNLYADPRKAPKAGIDAFLNGFAGQYELLQKTYQVIVRKLPSAEFYTQPTTGSG